MKKDGKRTVQKFNKPTIKGLNNSEMNEISNTELKRMIQMLKKIKEDIYIHISQ
jgi:hypothetical protein